MARFSGVIKLIVFLMILGFAGITIAQEKKDKVIVTNTVKSIEGEISAITKNFIAVVYQRNRERGSEREISFPFDIKNIQLIHKRSLAEFKEGDIVSIQYEEIKEESKEVKKAANKVRSITFLKPAAVKPQAVELEAPEMPIKGLRTE